MAKFCKNCGNELEEDASFCTECGFNFEENQSSSNNSYSNNNNPFKLYNVNMIDGEEIVRSSQIHVGCLYLPGIVMIIGLIFGLFWAISSNLIYFTPGAFLLLFINPIFILGLIWFIIRYYGYKNNDLILTNKRIFGKCGLISTNHLQSPLNKIDSVSFSNGLVGKLIGYGTIIIATTSSVYKFRFVGDGQNLANDVFNQLEISQKENMDQQAKAIAKAIKNS